MCCSGRLPLVESHEVADAGHQREALTRGPNSGRRDRAEPLARPTRTNTGNPHAVVAVVPVGAVRREAEAVNALLFRARVAVLWVAVAVAMSGSLLLALYAPGALEELLAGEMEGETLDSTWGIVFAAMVVIPLVMAGVTLLVSDRVSRYLNLAAGLALALLGALPVMEILDGTFDGHVVMALTAAALGLLIAGLSVVELRKPTSREANVVDAARVTV